MIYEIKNEESDCAISINKTFLPDQVEITVNHMNLQATAMFDDPKQIEQLMNILRDCYYSMLQSDF